MKRHHRDLATLLAELRVERAEDVAVRELARMAGENERYFRALSKHVNVGVTRIEAELLLERGARLVS